MSAGPIKQWRDAWKPPQVSTSPTTAVHALGTAPRAYCGRKGVTMTTETRGVTCADCRAALTADTDTTNA